MPVTGRPVASRARLSRFLPAALATLAALPAVAGRAGAAPASSRVTVATAAGGSGGHSPPSLRVDDRARPIRYRVRLEVQPDRESFSGVIDIDIDVRRPTDLLWLNSTELKIANATISSGGQTSAVRVIPGNADFVGFAMVKPLPAGPATLHVEYSGSPSRRDDRGLFTQKEGDRWYAITQFEPIFARRTFPCFDQPDFKTPWQVTLEVPEKLEAISNTPVQSTKQEHPGMKTVQFGETPPLPSYLVAFAVGPFDVVDAGRAGQHQTPLHLMVPAGRAADAKWPASVAGELLTLLEKYFGIAYPFGKLDNVSIPITSTFGAMENVGMVTYVNDLLVAQPSDQGLKFRRAFAETAAHEFAHQWFGDLVTTAWWDDIWLNESFATWMEDKIIDQWRPEWLNHTGIVENRRWALAGDSLVSARRIRQPIASDDDIYNAFDGAITYSKGSVILAMFERFIGADVFQRGVRAYLQAHANGNATVDDFVGSLSAAAGRDLSPAFKSFLDQPGAPLLDAHLQCGNGKPPALALSQQRFLPVGSKGSTNQRWQIPMCARWVAGGKTGRTCGFVTEQKMTMPLGDAVACPTWLLANDGQLGYYRSLYDGAQLRALLGDDGRKLLSLPELVGLLDDVAALTQAGRMPLSDALALTPSLMQDSRRQVLESAIGLTYGLREHLVPAAQRPRLARFIDKVFGPRAHALGWIPRAGEDEDTRLLRGNILALVDDEGEDAALRAQARELAQRWLTDRHAIDADLVTAVLWSAGLSGDRALFDRFVAEAKKAPERRDREHLFDALAAFPGTAMHKAALDVVLADGVDTRESLTVLFQLAKRDEEGARLAWQFLQSHFDALLKRLSPELMGETPFVAGNFCDGEHARQVEAFYRKRVAQLPGAPRNLAQAVERIELCGALVKAQQPNVAKFLASY